MAVLLRSNAHIWLSDFVVILNMLVSKLSRFNARLEGTDRFEYCWRLVGHIICQHRVKMVAGRSKNNDSFYTDSRSVQDSQGKKHKNTNLNIE